METHELLSNLARDSDWEAARREYARHVEAFKAEGWAWDIREGGDTYIHIDDLEKIEGPPPAGAF